MHEAHLESPQENSKTRHVTHYCCQQFYLAHGVEMTKIHHVISFEQCAFMLPFVKYCNDGRKIAKSKFESLMYKLIANVFCGRTVENIRK